MRGYLFAMNIHDILIFKRIENEKLTTNGITSNVKSKSITDITT